MSPALVTRMRPPSTATDAAKGPSESGRASRAVCAGRALDDTGRLWGQEVSLRWVYVHLVEEYARHNGHADLVRERIDGVTGT